jgi:uncharacterized protein YkwD
MRYLKVIAATIICIALFKVETCFPQENIRRDILQEVNHIRRSGCMCGEEYMPPVKELAWSAQLERAAREHAEDMFRNDFFDHGSSDGSTLADRVDATGFKWSIIGENICWGYNSVEDAVQGWIDSPGHCHNMMNAQFRIMGAARKGSYWVLDLGKED